MRDRVIIVIPDIIKTWTVLNTNNLVQKNQSRILKEYTQSVYNHDSKIYSASDRTNYILGIAFK